MPFEPLRTDEPLKGAPPPQRDMDTHMLFGCSGFIFVSVATYGLAVWPHFFFPDVYRLASLLTCSALGMVPAWMLGAVATRKMGLAGACGFVGGAMAAAVFFRLRLEQIQIAAKVDTLARADYPLGMVWVVPAAWMLVSLILVLLLLKRSEIS